MEEYFTKTLEQRIPEEAINYVVAHLSKQPTELVVKSKRKTVLGTYHIPRSSAEKHLITVNEDLNQYAFLFTLMHEVAHLKVNVNYGANDSILPHGKEWQATFKAIIFEIMEFFPEDIAFAIKNYQEDMSAATCRDKNLYKAFKKYDKKEVIFLDDIPINSLFTVNEYPYHFVKQKKLRKNYLCYNTNNKKLYKISGLVDVKLVS